MTQGPPVSESEKSRRHAANVIYLVFLLLIFEGAIRKYVVADYQRYFIVMRDPAVLYLYYIIRKSITFRMPFVLVYGCILLVVAVIVAGYQFSDDPAVNRVILSIYGMRQYFMLIFLPFIMARVLRQEDMARLMRASLFVMVLMAPFMVAQVVAPPDSIINVGVASDPSLAFENLSYGDYVRAPGFFSSSLPLVIFLPLISAIILIQGAAGRAGTGCPPVLAGAAALALMVAVSVAGNRGAVVALAITLVAALVMLPFISRGRNVAGTLGIVLLLGGGGFAVFTGFFADQYSALDERFTGAAVTEGQFGIISRAFGQFTQFVDVIDDVPATGLGLGLATNAGVIMENVADDPELLAKFENDWSRHIVDLGPIVGIAYIGFRIALVLLLAARAFRTLRAFGDPRAWLLLSATAPILLNGTVTGNSTVGGLAWFAAGLVLAASTLRPESRA